MAAQDATLLFLIQVAYGVRDFQVTGGPGWMNTEHYDITAKGEDGAQQSQLPLMLQSLLAHRFKVTFHRETKEMPVYFLMAAKGGIKLAEPKEGSCVAVGPNGPEPTPGQQPRNLCGNMRRSSRGLDAFRIGMWQLTMFFSDVLRRPVIDKTDFKGTFDAHLEFARDEALTAGILGNTAPGGPGGPPPPPADSSAPSIFAAVQEQLGLKLEPTKGPVEFLVIDHVEKPSEN
jgi:bla regulator protein blaR1